MKRLPTVILINLLFSGSLLAQTFSTARLIDAWSADDTSQTTQAEAVCIDLTRHIDPAAWASRMTELRNYLKKHPSARLETRILIYGILGKEELNQPLTADDKKDMLRAVTLAGLTNDNQLLSETYTLYGERSGTAARIFYDLKAIDLQEKIGASHFPMLWMRYLMVSRALYDYQQFRESIRYGKRALDLIEARPSLKHRYELQVVLQLDVIGASYYALNRADSTGYFYRRLESILLHDPVPDGSKQKIWKGIAAGGKGMALFLQKKYREALPLLQQNVAISTAFGQFADAAKAENMVARIHFDEKKYNIALAEWERSRQWAIAGRDMEKTAYALQGISEAYRALGKYDSAYRYNEAYHQYRDTILNMNTRNRLEAVNRRIQYGEMQTQLARSRNYIRQQEGLRNRIIGGIALAALFLALLFYAYNNRQQHRQERLLHGQQMARLETANARQQIEDFSKSISEKMQIIATLQSRIEGNADEALIEDLRHFTILTDDDWHRFKETFEKVYPGYWSRLNEKFSVLTDAEKRFMAFSKLGLNAREMAAASGIAPQAIHVQTHRMRKKLLISETSDLKDIAHHI